MAGFSSAFRFASLVGRVDAMKVCVAEFPGHVEMCPDMVENLLEPALTSKFLGADFVVMIYVVLLDLHPVVTEATAEQVGPSYVILRGHEKFEASFTIVGRHVEKRIIL
jgi:hypothetical protein